MVKTPAGYAPNMRCKSQPTIQQDTKTHSFGGYLDVSSSKRDLLASDPRQLMWSAEPDELREHIMRHVGRYKNLCDELCQS